MMSHESLIRGYIEGLVALSEQRPLHPLVMLNFIQCRHLIEVNLATSEWWMMGYDSQLISLLLRVGDDFFGKGNVEAALRFYKEAVSLFPGTPICLVKVAECHHRMGQVNEAKKNCLKGIHCSEKLHVALQEDDMIKMVDILMAADELNEALKIACRILEKSPLNVGAQRRIKKIEKRLEEKALENEEKEKEKKKKEERKLKQAAKREKIKKRGLIGQNPAVPKVEKSSKEKKKEQLARQKKIEEAIKDAKKKQEEDEKKKEKDKERIRKQEANQSAEKTASPPASSRFDVIAALEVTQCKKSQSSMPTPKNENDKVVRSQQPKSKSSTGRPLPSTRSKLSMNEMPTHMDEHLSSGSVVRRFCPKCSSPRAVKSQTKKCHICQSELKLVYKKANSTNWLEPRKPPETVKPGKYLQCKHFQLGRTCLKTPCTFAHGQDEVEIWELCRGKSKRRNRSKSTNAATNQKSASCMTLFECDSNSGRRPRTTSRNSTQSLQPYNRPFDTWSNVSRSTDDLCHDDFDEQSTRESSYELSQEDFAWSGELNSESLTSCSYETCDDDWGVDVTRQISGVVPNGDAVSGVATSSGTSQTSVEDLTVDEWTTVTKKRKKTNSVSASTKKGFQILCGFCRYVMSVLEDLQVICEPILCRNCNRTEKPIQQYWDSQAERFRTLRTKPPGIKSVHLCWHYRNKLVHDMPDCKFAHGNLEKILWEKEIEEEKNCQKTPTVVIQQNPPQNSSSGASCMASSLLEQESLRCRFCDVKFSSVQELEYHSSESHHKLTVIKRLYQPEPSRLQSRPEPALPKPEPTLKCRPPPEGVYMGRYKLCHRFENGGWCIRGNKCTFAHGINELRIWKEIFDRQRKHLARLKQEKLFLESFSEKIRKRIRTEGRTMLKESLHGVTLRCSSEATVELNRPQEHTWVFDVRIKRNEQKLLNQVALLLEEHLDKFKLLKSPDESEQKPTTQCVQLREDDFVEDCANYESAVQFCVKFNSGVFGEFRQELVLDFGGQSYLSQCLNVSVMSDDIRGKQESPRQSVSCQILDWSVENMKLVLCPELIDGEDLRQQYNIPRDILDPTTLEEFTRETYCKLWHDILFFEEYHICDEVARYDINDSKMKITNELKTANETVYGLQGELFGEIALADFLFMDEASGHLIQRSVLSVIVRPKKNQNESLKVYECLIKLRTPQYIVIKVNQELCEDLALQKEMVINVDLKFRFNRFPMCEMHQAIDRCKKKTDFLLPAVKLRSNEQQKSISTWYMVRKPNDNQHKAITMILDPSPAPPLLLIGPFGTGKTFTLNMACLEVFRKSKDSKVLICTHSNSAADIHLDLLHNKQRESTSQRHLRPLRVLNPMRKVQTIPTDLRKYCLLDGNGQILEPTWNDVQTHNVIITTLATSRVLWKFYDEGRLRFTHIMIDEAAQALEPECVTPLSMADDATKVILAGDHVQMGPSVYSKRWWAEDLGPGRSLLERLFTHYQKTVSQEDSTSADNGSNETPYVVMLTENYRCHEDILAFPSECFYGGELLARGDQLTHPSIPALSFYTAQGRDEKLEGSLAYYNLAEVAEIVKRVEELVNLWPRDWKGSIGVLTPYRDQVRLLREALRKKRLHQVNVDTVENVQGKEFQALFISTVRTGWTCLPLEERKPDSGDLDFGFLSDVRLLNTAVTRAQSLLAVVGDPMSLCAVGSCMNIWKDYLKRCDSKKGFHGCTLKAVMDYCISSRMLNPSAEEFTPRMKTDQTDGGSVQSSSPRSDVPSGNTDITFSPSSEDKAGHTSVIKDLSSSPSTASGDGIHEQKENQLVSPTTSASCSSQSSETRTLTQEQELENQNPSVPVVNQDNKNKHSGENTVETKTIANNSTAEDDKIEELRNASSTISATRDESPNIISAQVQNVGHSNAEEEKQSTDDFFNAEGIESYDEIVKALVQACKETKKKGELGNSQGTSDEDFPPLNGDNIISPGTPQWPRNYTSSRSFYAGLRNGEIELGFHIQESERLFRLTGGSSSSHAPGERLDNETQAYKPDQLLTLLKANPEVYSQCTFRIDSSGRQRKYYGQVPDPDSPDIHIPGRVRGAYEDDQVVIEMQQNVLLDQGDVQPKRGFIIGVLRRLIDPKERQFVCTVDRENLGVMLPINKSLPKLMNFTKTDEKNIIPTYEMNNGSVTKAVVLRNKQVKEALAGERVFVVRYLKWRVDCPYPLGLAVRHLSYGKDFRTGMEILYEEYNVKRKFSEKVLASCERDFGSAEDWKIPAGEKFRPAYRKAVFTVDPPESRDLDDAISVRVVGGDNYEVGIHIADVSYFVRPNTPLDEEALSRGTSYYPPKTHDVVPMLPRQLSEGCCSMLEGKDRLSVSVFVEMKSNGTVIGEPRFERTIVRSCCRLTYHEAQEIIDEGMSKGYDDGEGKPLDSESKVSGGVDVKEEEVFSRESNESKIRSDLNEIKGGRSQENGDNVKVPGNESETRDDASTKNTENKKKKKRKGDCEIGRDEREEVEKQQEIEMKDDIDAAGRIIESGQKAAVATNNGEVGEGKGSEATDSVPERKKEIPNEVKYAIRLAHSLAINRRKFRLGERSFYHRKEEGENGKGEDREAHEMIAEMMIMANHLVAKYLLGKSPGCTPLRVQLPPKTYRAEEWKSRFQKFASLSLGIKSTSDSCNDTEELMEPVIQVPSMTWEKIISAHDDSNFQELVELICDEDEYPQLALAHAHQQKLQQRASYTCSGETTTDIQQAHSSLELDVYCHFTSPIRRYIDVLVHRLVINCMESDQQGEANQRNTSYTLEEVTTICDRCTFLSRNSTRFERDAKKLQLAVDLKNSAKFVNAMIDEVARDMLKLFFGSKELDLLRGKEKSVRVARLAPIKDPDVSGEEMTMEWKFRVLQVPQDGEGKGTADKNNDNEGCNEKNNVMLEIPGKMWRCLLEAVKNEDKESLGESVKAVDQTIHHQMSVIHEMASEISQNKGAKPIQSVRMPYQHPNTGNRGKSQSETQETVDFLTVKKSFKSCDTVRVQLCSQVSRGILSPTIQLFEITKKMHVCLEHRNSPTTCFVKSSAQNASYKEYSDIEEYVSLWRPVLMMEITTSAVQEDDTITLINLEVKFSCEENSKLSMEFRMDTAYSQNYRSEIGYLDLVCVRVKNPKEKRRQAGFWVGHFQISPCETKKDEKVPAVKAHSIQSSSPAPEFLIDQKCLVTAEIIHLTTPDRYHLAALNHSNVASDFAQNICIGVPHEIADDDVHLPTKDLSLCKSYPSLFNPLNKYQSKAVEEALTKPFSLIQGPPGTGKTVTGVHIAYWFAKMNRTRGRDPVKDAEMSNNQPMVFYCGPSNKSVDVVARYLKKIPELKILRIYSDEIEQKEFPVPDKIRAFRRKHVSAQLKMDEELRDISLHHVIRSSLSPHARKLREYDQYFRECLDKSENVEHMKIVEYKQEKRTAEKWAIYHNQVDIILCTCTAAYGPRIEADFNQYRQCIVDECGMCIEADTLCAMLGTNATQVVLIGDHKQLQPVLKNDKAKQLGLAVSMFERYSQKSRMLQIQYRMHKEICEFPSNYFYDGELKTAQQVLDRQRDNVQIWPKGSDFPFMFYHTVGKEESLVVTTDQGNENSKRNEKEISKVVHFARTLVREGVSKENILVLSPYKAQCHYVKQELHKHGLMDVSVTTVVASQGSEKDYVILSLVRSLPEREIEKNPSRSWLTENLGFLTDEHQINVALTRSKRGLCIIGNANLVRVCDVWKALLEHCQKNDSLLFDDQRPR